MAETGHDAVDAICDLLLAEDLGVNQVTSGPWSKTLPQFVVHPVGMVGTDSTFIGEKPARGPTARSRGSSASSCATRRLLSLEEAVRKMTGAAAARLGLTAARAAARRRRSPTSSSSTRRPSAANATYDEPRQFPDRHRARHRQRHARRATMASTPARRRARASASGSTDYVGSGAHCKRA